MLAPGLTIALVIRGLVLPGSSLEIEQAKVQATYIVAARVEATPEPMVVVGPDADPIRGAEPPSAGQLTPRRASTLWTRLRPLEYLKGALSTDDLNRLPLNLTAIGRERLPVEGGTYLFFINNRSISKVVLDTPAQRMVIANAPATVGAYLHSHAPQAEVGLGPFHVAGPLGLAFGEKSEPPTPIVRELGVKIQPRPNAGEAERAFARLFPAQDPRPADRATHFAWLDADEVYRRYTIAHKGWLARFQDIRPVGNDAWRITISLTPNLHTHLRHSQVSDTVEETYELKDNTIRLLDSNARTPKPRCQVFPVAF